MKNVYPVILGASAMWMLVWGATGVYMADYAAETDALYGEPLAAERARTSDLLLRRQGRFRFRNLRTGRHPSLWAGCR